MKLLSLKGVKMNQYYDEIKPYFDPVELMVLASAKDNQPWCAAVYYAFDKDLNLFFLSNISRRHSKEITENPKISLEIADQSQKLGDPSKGIQIEGDCTALTGEEIDTPFETFSKRYSKVGQFVTLEGLKKSDATDRLWKVVPRMIKIFDVEKYGHNGKELR